MKLSRIILQLLVLTVGSFLVMPLTLARYTDEYSGSDTVLIAKWNFHAKGENDTQYYNKGFTFDLFNANAVEPMDLGENSFSFKSGSSDVAIEYNVEMKANELIKLTSENNKAVIATQSEKDVYAPFIFKVSAAMSAGAQDSSPIVFQTNWFRLQDQDLDEEGYFSIFDLTDGKPTFSTGSTDEVTVTIQWQWNTSYYINDTGVAEVTPNPDTTLGSGKYLSYYQIAYDEYYVGGLQDQREAAFNAIDAYLNVHGSPQPDGTWPPDGDCTEDHYASYDALVATANAAIEACNSSLLVAYDDYDTFAAHALNAKPLVQVIFRISGDQVQPN